MRQNGLNKALERLLIEKSFSVEFMEAVKELQRNYDHAMDEIKRANEALEKRNKQIDELSAINAELTVEVNRLRDQTGSRAMWEQDVLSMEVRPDPINKEAGSNATRISDVKEMFNSIFRNTSLLRMVNEATTVMPAGDRFGERLYPETFTQNMDEEIMVEQ